MDGPVTAGLWREWAAAPDQEARRRIKNTLITAYIPEVVAIARGDADLVQAGLIRMEQLVDEFDPGRGVGFMGFARKKIAWAMTDARRRGDAAARRMPGGRRFVALESAEGVGGGGARAVLEVDRADLFRTLTRPLTRRQRRMVEGIYVDRLSLAEMGRALGIAKGSAQTLHRRAIAQLRRQPECLRRLLEAMGGSEK